MTDRKICEASLQMEKIYTPSELKDILQVSYQTVVGLIDSGRLEGIDLATTGKRKLRRVSETALRRFIDNDSGKKLESKISLPQEEEHFRTGRRLRLNNKPR